MIRKQLVGSPRLFVGLHDRANCGVMTLHHRGRLADGDSVHLREVDDSDTLGMGQGLLDPLTAVLAHRLIGQCQLLALSHNALALVAYGHENFLVLQDFVAKVDLDPRQLALGL